MGEWSLFDDGGLKVDEENILLELCSFLYLAWSVQQDDGLYNCLYSLLVLCISRHWLGRLSVWLLCIACFATPTFMPMSTSLIMPSKRYMFLERLEKPRGESEFVQEYRYFNVFDIHLRFYGATRMYVAFIVGYISDRDLAETGRLEWVPDAYIHSRVWFSGAMLIFSFQQYARCE